jgi:protein TonB
VTGGDRLMPDLDARFLGGNSLEAKYIDARQAASRRLWVFAALAALALHIAAAALAFANLGGELDEGGLGANADEIAVEVGAPRVDDDQLAPGPDLDPAQASQQVAEQKAETHDTELPMDRPNEAEEPDRLVTQSNQDKPPEDEPKVAAVETPAAIEQPAQQETSRKTLEDAPEAEKAKAPIIGIDKDKEKLTADWGLKVNAYFKLHKRFPEGKNKRKSGRVTVFIELNRLGHVTAVRVEQSSGYAAFDEAAIAMVRRSDPVPRPPAALTDEEFKFTLAVDFSEPR